MRKNDMLTLVGLIGGMVLLSIAIILAGGLIGAKIFFSISSFITTVGGLVASIMVHFTTKELREMFSSLKNAFSHVEQDINELVEDFINLSTMARREGLLALDNQVEDLNDPFIKKGILLTVDGLEAEVIREILSAELVALEEKQKIGKTVLEKAGELAPAWGMIGTLIGLILMLQNLDDPKNIGPSMALALITTFYGAVLANLFFIPLAGKLANRTEQDIYIKQIMIEGILGVQSGQNPKLLREKLEVFIDSDNKIHQEDIEGDEALGDEEVAY